MAEGGERLRTELDNVGWLEMKLLMRFNRKHCKELNIFCRELLVL
jgi:hypothetical protein